MQGKSPFLPNIIDSCTAGEDRITNLGQERKNIGQFAHGSSGVEDNGLSGSANFPDSFSWEVPELPSLSADWGETAKAAIKAVKDQFGDGFSWNIPELKMPVKLPKYKVDGKWEFDDDGNISKTPKITVEWYKLAAKMGALFNEPTIIGVGDASQPEMLIGEDTLYNSIRAAVMDSTGGGFNQTNNITVENTETAAETARRIRNETRQLLSRMRGGL